MPVVVREQESQLRPLSVADPLRYRSNLRNIITAVTHSLAFGSNEVNVGTVNEGKMRALCRVHQVRVEASTYTDTQTFGARCMICPISNLKLTDTPTQPMHHIGVLVSVESMRSPG